MKCYYEVLQVPRDVTNDDLKKSYRKLALQCHPDKNLDNIEEATEKFREIQQAYDVLIDPHERAWYDRHREEILRGGMKDDYEDSSLNVFQYFTSSCYSGYNDDPKGFYTIYRNVFETIAKEDLEFTNDKDSDFEIPSFGSSDSLYDEVVHEFYAYWQSYCTSKPYGWADKYDIRTAPNRRVLRLMEKENKKLRDQMRRKRNEEVRALVAFVRKRDKRVQMYRKQLEERAAANARKSEENRKKQIEEHKRQIQEYRESQWMSMASLEEELKRIEDDVSNEFGDNFATDGGEEQENVCSSSDEFLDYDTLYCIACDKAFKTEKAFANHENSKKHKENVAVIKAQMVEDDESFGLGGVLDEPEVGDEDTSLDHAADSDESFSDDMQEEKKKKKKKQKKTPKLQTVYNEVDEEENDSKKDVEKDIIEVVCAKEELDGKITTPVPQQSNVKLKGKKAKEAKRKAKLESGSTSNAVQEPTLQCSVCGTTFPTRNKLFDHLKLKGHAVVINSKSKTQSYDSNSTKKTLKKKER